MDIEWKLGEDGKPIPYTRPIYFNPVCWEDWIKLPVRPYDLAIRSTKMEIRVPTVVIAQKYDKMPKKKPKKTPSNQGVKFRDGGRCQYTGELIEDDEGSVDHIIPLSRGGTDTWDNVAWAKKEINARKGNALNSEIGLQLIQQPRQPREVELWETIRKPMHPDWVPFMRKLAKNLHD
jgi:5-methylcytosine-specific restriction endonuclease McrA